MHGVADQEAIQELKIALCFVTGVELEAQILYQKQGGPQLEDLPIATEVMLWSLVVRDLDMAICI